MRKLLVVLLICTFGLLPVAQSHAGTYPDTEVNLMAAVTGESNANATYLAFAAAADAEGHLEIAAIFRAISEAELKHAEDEWDILVSYDASAVRPTAVAGATGTTAQNLQAAINGETAESNDMYPAFIASADAEGATAARRIFNYARQAEAIHAGIYADLLANISSFDAVKYEKIYRCPVCGNIIPTTPVRCPICNVAATGLVEYTIVSSGATYPDTEVNLMAAVTGESGANATYLAFATVADAEGRTEIAAIFRAIAAAEMKHANDEWAILATYDPTVVRPTPAAGSTGTTAQNLQAAVNGETYEFTIMYPDFIVSADAEGETAGRAIFDLARQAEAVHAGIYADLLANINNFDKVKYEKIYRCPVCGNIILTTATTCPICGVPASNLVEYQIYTGGSGGGGGCNIGFAILPMGFIPFFIRRKY